jgi:poly-gamma-glutamate capsule biosynthesis protein CapA/YwtB (metallophosphatase superfamily)/poly(3-hydroxybutyrate) depolymerase
MKTAPPRPLLPRLAIFAVSTLLAALAAVPLRAAPKTLASGEGRFDFTHDGKTIPVWYHVPQNARPDVPVLFVMHGVKRDAERYRDEWLPHARKYGFILVAPEFSEASFPGPDAYNYGGTVDDQGRPQPREKWAFSFLEPLFDQVKAATGNRSSLYHLYGHSAGAQFVHRYLYFVPKARIATAVAANAGWWTLPDLQTQFPYGLRGCVVDEGGLKTMLQRPLVVLLGTEDTDPNHPELRRTPEAMAQGPHRFARGQFFFAAGQKKAAALKVPFGWKLATAPGVAHHDDGMSAFAVEWLFGKHASSGGSAPARLRVLIGGDTCFGESYQEEYAQKGEANVLVQKGYGHGLAQLGRLLEAVDYRILNLETPLTARRDSPNKGKDYLHYSDAAKTTALFGRYGPTAFSLANNHTLDQGVPGLDDTTAALDAAGIRWFGAGRNLAEASRPLLQTLPVGGGSLHLAVFGAFEYKKTYDEAYHFYAGADRAGTAPIDVPAVQRAVADLRRTTPDVYVICFVHWGENYQWKNSAQTATAHALRQAGVDLVVGAHAHTMQEIEHDGSGWIFYGVGNFLFNARGRYAANHAAPFSIPLVVDFSLKDGRVQTGLRIYPIFGDNQITGYQPRFATESELATVDALLEEKSGWNGPVRAAVRRGVDAVGHYLEFLPPSTATK